MSDMPSDDSIAAARERVAALRVALEARDGRPVRLVETHISGVLVGDSVVHKLKKPARDLAFRFVDAYLEAGGDHDGLPALRFLLVCRALVRWLAA
ncbi:hypothetical protein [Piscinibacter sp.]|uniref:hypothetical protein n=1 Tax=Piscinibacter sp. TaxID=1903157 RepID=UPI002C073B7B|nr:hypothetical protein [Albitalea sp.]HUG26201.1 hypothetical protein [Albitalea sp.]